MTLFRSSPSYCCVDTLSEIMSCLYEQPFEDYKHLESCRKILDDIHTFFNPDRMHSNQFSRQMKNKIKTLIQCDIQAEHGRLKACKAAKSIGERAITEILIKQKDAHSVSTSLWTAVRARGCQFLGKFTMIQVIISVNLTMLILQDPRCRKKFSN